MKIIPDRKITSMNKIELCKNKTNDTCYTLPQSSGLFMQGKKRLHEQRRIIRR